MFVARRVSAKVNPLVRSFSAASGDSIQLYQYAICPFCNRVKALLDYARIEYSTIEVNPLTKAEIKWYA